MVTFRNNNNNRRNNFRRNDRNFKSNGDRPKFGANFSNNENFQRKIPGRNNHNASKLIEKYNNLAREALSNGDKILYENYFQHADHFTRVLNEQESFRKSRVSNQLAEEKKIDGITDDKVHKKVELTEEEIINEKKDPTKVKSSLTK
ncbi:DUF4167 domain-containing protein [Pelagibacterales bacterium SAG-MED24]|nr:DUF4167 domain-containing protein [Pelagibacterales bacterium SAG-MED24]